MAVSLECERAVDEKFPTLSCALAMEFFCCFNLGVSLHSRHFTILSSVVNRSAIAVYHTVLVPIAFDVWVLVVLLHTTQIGEKTPSFGGMQ